MRLANFDILVKLLILLEYVAEGINFDYSAPEDFRHYESDGFQVFPLSSGGNAVKCVNGTFFNMNCNSCICNADTGLTICTSMKCLSNRETEQSSKGKRNTKCRSGSYYQRDCNICYCDPSTGDLICTKVACSKNRENLKAKLHYTHGKIDKILKDVATCCKPPTLIEVGNCRCTCDIPSVMICDCKSD